MPLQVDVMIALCLPGCCVYILASRRPPECHRSGAVTGLVENRCATQAGSDVHVTVNRECLKQGLARKLGAKQCVCISNSGSVLHFGSNSKPDCVVISVVAVCIAMKSSKGSKSASRLAVRKTLKRPEENVNPAWVFNYDANTNPCSIPCALCTRHIESWFLFKQHLFKVHHKQASDWAGTFLGAQLQNKQTGITAHEVECVDIDENNARRFICRLCGKSQSKKNALRHMRTHQADLFDRGIHDDDVKLWIVVKEGWTIGNTTGSEPSLTTAMEVFNVRNALDGELPTAIEACNIDGELRDGECALGDDASDLGDNEYALVDASDGGDGLPLGHASAIAQMFIAMPGERTLMRVPGHVAEELVAHGLAHHLQNGCLGWHGEVPIGIQQQTLLELLPDDEHRMMLARKFGAAAPGPTQPQCHQTLHSDELVRWQAPQAVRGTDLMEELFKLQALMVSLASGKPRAAVQHLSIRNECSIFDWPKDAADKLKHPWPLGHVTLIFDDAFDKFMSARGLKGNTRHVYMLALSRFQSLFEGVDGCEVKRDNLLLSVWGSNLFEAVRGLRVLADWYSCTRQMVHALGHAAVMNKLRYQAANDGNAASSMSQLIDGYLAPWTKLCSAAQKLSSGKKYTTDSIIIEEQYPSKDRLRQFARSCYMDLKSIHDAVCGTGERTLTPQLLFKATACVMGALYTNSPPGRSMELETLERSVIETFLAGDDDWFPYDNYKTSKVYGTGGKWVGPPNKKSFVLYKDIVDSNPELVPNAQDPDACFFQRHPISVFSCLRGASLAHNLDLHIKVNLARKAYAVWAKTGNTETDSGDVDDDLFAKVARVDKHSTQLAHGVYAALTPRQDATMAEYCFTRLMGSQVPFPSDEEWAIDGRSVEQILAKHRFDDGNAEAEYEDEPDLIDLVDSDTGEVDADWAAVLNAGEGTDEQGSAVSLGRRPKAAPTTRSVPKAAKANVQRKARNVGEVIDIPASANDADPSGDLQRGEENDDVREIDDAMEPSGVCELGHSTLNTTPRYATFSDVARELDERPSTRAMVIDQGSSRHQNICVLRTLDEATLTWSVEFEDGSCANVRWENIMTLPLDSGVCDQAGIAQLSDPATATQERKDMLDEQHDSEGTMRTVVASRRAFHRGRDASNDECSENQHDQPFNWRGFVNLDKELAQIRDRAAAEQAPHNEIGEANAREESEPLVISSRPVSQPRESEPSIARSDVADTLEPDGVVATSANGCISPLKTRGPRLTPQQHAWIEREHSEYIESPEGSVAKYTTGYASPAWFQAALLKGQTQVPPIFNGRTGFDALRTHVKKACLELRQQR